MVYCFMVCHFIVFWRTDLLVYLVAGCLFTGLLVKAGSLVSQPAGSMAKSQPFGFQWNLVCVRGTTHSDLQWNLVCGGRPSDSLWNHPVWGDPPHVKHMQVDTPGPWDTLNTSI